MLAFLSQTTLPPSKLIYQLCLVEGHVLMSKNNTVTTATKYTTTNLTTITTTTTIYCGNHYLPNEL